MSEPANKPTPLEPITAKVTPRAAWTAQVGKTTTLGFRPDVEGGRVYAAASGMAGGFGWGKPVQWQAHRVSRRVSMSTAKILVAFAGPQYTIAVVPDRARQLLTRFDPVSAHYEVVGRFQYRAEPT